MPIDLERREGEQPVRLHDERRRASDDGKRALRSARDTRLLAQKSLFADNVRFLSMVAIVGFHSAGAMSTLLVNQSNIGALRVLETFEKFGTIGFFFVSGFLLGERFETMDRLSFLGRRLNKICLPWLVWFMAFVLKGVAGQQLLHTIRLRLDLASVEVIVLAAKGCLTVTSYWFIPNLFLSLCMLILFRRYLRSLWLGAALLSITAFYAVNVYTRWIPSSHTTALGGYVFFLWLGALASRQYAWIRVVLDRITMPFVLLVVMAIGALSLLDGEVMRRLGNLDGMNSLRPMNILFSLAVLALIGKLERASWPSVIDVRGQMFGVYLSHWIVLSIVVGPLLRFHIRPTPAGGISGASEEVAGAIIITIGVFFISLMITEFIRRKASLAWLVGDTSRSKPEHQIGAPWAQSPAQVLRDAGME